eukprot:m.1216027 g.1216027  ORF g.1216027 m.1216027 type:complete len:378 (-) comp24613_c0_seq4:159-1292(-)
MTRTSSAVHLRSRLDMPPMLTASHKHSSTSGVGHERWGNVLVTIVCICMQASEILGTFEVSYLGALPCQESRGVHVVQATAQRMFDSGKMTATKCALIITGGGLKAVDTVSSQAVSVANIVSITFTAAVSDKPLVKQVRSVVPTCGVLFGYIVKDDALNRVTCAVFACNKADVATQLAGAIQKAFEVQKEIQKLRRTNPFAAISSKREASPRSLYKLQIHRADLSAIKVIGFGQFGEVYKAKHVLKVPNPAPGAPKTTSMVRAVKILRGNANTADRTEFLREAEVMVALKHPNLVELIGVAVQQRPWLTALEFLQYGDMLKVMTTCAEKNIELTDFEFYNVFAQMAAGVWLWCVAVSHSGSGWDKYIRVLDSMRSKC